jgi:hypothetical protein
LNVYVSRKKITITDKLIDDTIPENDYFYQNCIKNKSSEISVSVPETKGQIVPDSGQIVQKEVSQKRPSSPHIELDTAIKQAELFKKEVDTRIALIKEEKLKGEILPTELFKMLFARHTKSIHVEFHNSVDKMLIRISKRKHLNNEETTEIRKELIQEINNAILLAKDETLKDLKGMIKEYSEKRSAGEKGK